MPCWKWGIGRGWLHFQTAASNQIIKPLWAKICRQMPVITNQNEKKEEQHEVFNVIVAKHRPVFSRSCSQDQQQANAMLTGQRNWAILCQETEVRRGEIDFLWRLWYWCLIYVRGTSMQTHRDVFAGFLDSLFFVMTWVISAYMIAWMQQ